MANREALLSLAELRASSREAAEVFEWFAASFREQDAGAFAQEIAVAELAASDLRRAIGEGL